MPAAFVEKHRLNPRRPDNGDIICIFEISEFQRFQRCQKGKGRDRDREKRRGIIILCMCTYLSTSMFHIFLIIFMAIKSHLNIWIFKSPEIATPRAHRSDAVWWYNQLYHIYHVSYMYIYTHESYVWCILYSCILKPAIFEYLNIQIYLRWRPPRAHRSDAAGDTPPDGWRWYPKTRFDSDKDMRRPVLEKTGKREERGIVS